MDNIRLNPITLDRVLDTAVEIADSDGLKALSIRNLAAELDVAPMTLYGYVDSKDALLDKMAAHMLDRYELPAIANGDELDHLVANMSALRDLMLKHPSLPDLMTTRRVTSVGLTRSIDAALTLLLDAGLSPKESVRCYGSLLAFTLGYVVYELPRLGHEAGDRTVAETLRTISSARRFLNVQQLADELSTMAKDEEAFEIGLRAFLRGALGSESEIRTATPTTTQ